MQEDEKIYNTAVEATLEVIGGKWKPVILFHLTFGKKRNGELMQLLSSMSQKMLTQQLYRFSSLHCLSNAQGIILR